jgi:hypothetical protein
MKMEALLVLGRLQARRGDPDAARSLEEEAAAFRSSEAQWIVPLAVARAEHAWLHDDLDRCAAEASRGFDLAIEAGHPWYVGELAWWLGRAGALSEVTAVARSLRLLDGLGAAQAARRLRMGLHRDGRRVPRGPRPGTVANPAGLTGRQLEVLRLLAGA